MTRLVYDIYAPPDEDWLTVVNSDGYLVRVTDYGPQTSVRPRKPMGSGLLQIEKTQDFVNATNFAYGNYVIVRDLDRSEVDDTANVLYGFFLEEGDFDLVTDDPHWFYWGGRSTIAVLDYAVLPEEPLSPFQGPHDVIDGYWGWRSDVYGGVMKRAIVEVNAPGRVWLPMVAIRIVGGSIVGAGAQWDDSGDSNGDPWPSFAGEFRTQCGTSLLDLYGELYGYGVELEVDPRTFVFYAYNAGGYGTDRSSGTFAAGKVRFATGVNVAAKAGEVALRRQTHGTIRTTHLLVRTTTHPEGAIIVSDDYTPGDPIRVRAYQTGDIRGDPAASAVLQDRAQRDMDLRTLGEDAARFLIAPPEVGASYDDTAGIYVVGSNYAGNGPEVMDGAHVWLSDLVTIDSGDATTDYQEATKRIDGFDFELYEGNWVVYVIVGARFLVSGRMLSGTTPTVLPIALCEALTPGTESLIRLYFTGTSATARPGSASWTGGTTDMVTRALSLTPTATTSSAFSDWAAVNAAAAKYGLLQGTFTLSGSAALLANIQAGGTVRAQMLIGIRHGIGIDEGSHREYFEGLARVYRPGTSSYVGTSFDAGDATSGTFANNDVAGTLGNRALAGDTAAVGGAVSTDQLVVEVGLKHDAPTSGGAGGTVWWNDSAASDLPEDESTLSDLRSWIEFRSITAPTGEGLAPELVGVEPTASRCDHSHHIISNRAPETGDNITQGFPVKTQWTNTDTGQTWLLIDEDAGTWLPIGTAGEHTHTEDDITDLGHYLTKNLGEQHDLVVIDDAATTQNLGLGDANVFDVTLADDTAFTFSGATSGVGVRWWIIGRWAGFTPSFPASVIWPNDTEPTWSTDPDAVDVIEFLSDDGGVTIFGDAGGSGTSPTAALIVREVAGTDIDPVTELEFDAADFVVTDETGGVARVALAPGGSTTVWHPVMAQDPSGAEPDRWWVVVDGDGTAVMAEEP